MIELWIEDYMVWKASGLVPGQDILVHHGDGTTEVVHRHGGDCHTHLKEAPHPTT